VVLVKKNFFCIGCPLCPVRTGQPGKLGIQGAEGVEGINSLRRLAVWGRRGWRKPCHEVMRTALFWDANVCAQRGSQVRLSSFSFFEVKSVVWMHVKWCWDREDRQTDRRAPSSIVSSSSSRRSLSSHPFRTKFITPRVAHFPLRVTSSHDCWGSVSFGWAHKSSAGRLLEFERFV